MYTYCKVQIQKNKLIEVISNRKLSFVQMMHKGPI